MVPGTSNAGVFLACGFVVQMAAQVVAGLPFPVLMLVGKAWQSVHCSCMSVSAVS